MLTKTLSNQTHKIRKSNIQSFIPTTENKLWLDMQQKATKKTYTQILNESLQAIRLNQTTPPVPDWLKQKMAKSKLLNQDWADFDQARQEFRKNTTFNLERDKND
jgi:hypothetical protein